MNSFARVLLMTLATTLAFAGPSEVRGSETSPGWAQWEAGQFNEARALAEQALGQDSENADARHLMVLTDFVNGRYKDGLAHYARLDPDYARIRELDSLVIKAHKSLGQFDQAEAFARKTSQPENFVTMLGKQRKNPMTVALDKTTVVPFSQDHMIPQWMPAVPIEINGREYLGHLDTGGAYIHMSPRMADEIGLETLYVGKGEANARETNIEVGIVDSLRIGDALLTNVPAMALDSLEGALQDGEGNISDLIILGTSVLEQFLTTWDNDKQRLILSPRNNSGARKEHYSKYVAEEAEPMDFYMVPDHFLIAHGAIAGKDATFFVDTGLVTVDATGRQPGLSISAEKFKHYGGIPEPATAQYADAPGSIRLGPVALEDQGLMITQGQHSKGFTFSGVKTDALLGHGFLKHCVWTIDFDTRDWYLNCESEPGTPASAKSAVADADAYVGSYEVAPGVALEITAAGGDLYLQAPGQQKVALVADPDGSFSIPLAGARVTFEQNDSGAVTALVLDQSGHQTRGIRI